MVDGEWVLSLRSGGFVAMKCKTRGYRDRCTPKASIYLCGGECAEHRGNKYLSLLPIE